MEREREERRREGSGRKVLHSKECQLIHAEGMMKLENHHSETPN